MGRRRCRPKTRLAGDILALTGALGASMHLSMEHMIATANFWWPAS
jgi:hypothetical protein